MTKITIKQQCTAILRAGQILSEIYPERIKSGKATQDGANQHALWLENAYKTLLVLDRGVLGDIIRLCEKEE
jgi:hypothetical protein